MSQQNKSEQAEEINLQANKESIFDFDEDTGLLNSDVELAKTIADLEKVIYQANAFHQMKQTEGWGLVEKFITETVDGLTKQLIIEQDFENIRRRQSEIIAYQGILNIIEESFGDADKAYEQLQTLNRPDIDVG